MASFTYLSACCSYRQAQLPCQTQGAPCSIPGEEHVGTKVFDLSGQLLMSSIIFSPQIDISCGRSSPIWRPSTAAMTCPIRPRTAQLAIPKALHVDYKPPKQVSRIFYSYIPHIITNVYRITLWRHTQYVAARLHSHCSPKDDHQLFTIFA